jgi:membrane dipeptidase
VEEERIDQRRSPIVERAAAMETSLSSPPDVSESHMQMLVCNLHDDWSLEVERGVLAGQAGSLDRLYGPKVQQGGIDFSFYTVGGDDEMFTYDRDYVRGTLRAIDVARQEIAASQIFSLCTNAADIARAKSEGRVGLMLTIEGAAPLDGDLSILRNMYGLGLRSIIVTWFKANCAGDGVGERRDGGLTNFGREMVAEMGRLGMLIDISQSSPRTVDDVLESTKGPIVASHSNCGGLYQHVRNLTDDQLRGLAATGGVIGITSFPAHVGSEPSFDHFLDHIEYAVALVGVEHVGLGLNVVVHGDEQARSFYRRSNIDFTNLSLMGIENLESFPNITQGLVMRGFAQQDIARIMGGNVIRVIEKSIG